MVFLILLLLTVRVRMAAMILNRPFRRAIYGKALSYDLMLNDPLTTNPPPPGREAVPNRSDTEPLTWHCCILRPTPRTPSSARSALLPRPFSPPRLCRAPSTLRWSHRPPSFSCAVPLLLPPDRAHVGPYSRPLHSSCSLSLCFCHVTLCITSIVRTQYPSLTIFWLRDIRVAFRVLV